MPLALALCLAQASPGAAEQAAVSGGPVAQILLALRLHQRAEAAADGIWMMTAARLALGVDLRDDMLRQPQLEKSPAGPASGAGGQAAALDWLRSDEAVLAARIDAAEDEDLADVLSSATAPAAAGRRMVVTRSRTMLEPGQAARWRIVLPGQSPAEITVLAEGAGALAWQVLDSAGKPVCPPLAAADLALCSFTPAENGFYDVLVIAGSGESAGHALLTN